MDSRAVITVSKMSPRNSIAMVNIGSASSTILATHAMISLLVQMFTSVISSLPQKTFAGPWAPLFFVQEHGKLADDGGFMVEM